MKRIIWIFKNDLKRRLKAPLAVIFLLLIPLAMTGLIGLIFSPSANNQVMKIQVLMVDNDKRMASKFFQTAFNSPQMKGMFQIHSVSEALGRQLMSDGKASALIILGEKLTENLIKGEPAEISLTKNPAEQFFPHIVEDFMNTFTIIISGFVQVFENELKTFEEPGKMAMENISLATLSPFLTKSKDKINRIQRFLNPLLINIQKEVKINNKVEREPGFNIFSQILPGMSIMFLLFIIEIFLRDILSEREDGKLQRIMFSPIRSREFILGRIISGWLMGIFVSVIMLMCGSLIFKIQWGNGFHLFILVTVTCFWIASFLALLNAFFKNKNQAGAITSPIILVFSAFGGSIIQVSQLPGAFRSISILTPNFWYIEGMQQINGSYFPLIPVLVLSLSSLIIFILAVHFLNNRIKV